MTSRQKTRSRSTNWRFAFSINLILNFSIFTLIFDYLGPFLVCDYSLFQLQYNYTKCPHIVRLITEHRWLTNPNIQPLHSNLVRKTLLKEIEFLARVVQTLDSAIHRINHYPADKYWRNQLRYSVDSDLSVGQGYPPFEQLGPDEVITGSTKDIAAFCRTQYCLDLPCS